MFKDVNLYRLNHTALAHKFTVDLCKNSSPQRGIAFSQEYFEMMNEIKSFIFWNICSHKRLYYFKRYAKLVIETIFEVLLSYFAGKDTIQKMMKDIQFYPLLINHYKEWLEKYANVENRNPLYKNKVLYDLNSIDDYRYFLQGVSDKFTNEELRKSLKINIRYATLATNIFQYIGLLTVDGKTGKKNIYKIKDLSI